MNNKPEKLIEDLSWLTAPIPGQEGGLPWTWILVAALVLLALASVLFIRWRKGKSVLPFLTPPAPHVQALAALRDLEKLLQEGHEKEFVAEVSRVARVYIQGRFGLRAPHRSTEEFLWEAGQSRLLSQGHQELLGRFLMHCDLVKFARHGMGVHEMNGLLHSAREFVSATIPEEKKPDATGKKTAPVSATEASPGS
jgi:hypothetical protein